MTATRSVAAVWLGLTVALFVFITLFGRNAPMWEEWFDVAALYGESSRVEWVFGRLQQHRYILGRVAMLGVFHASGHDFRAGLYASVTLLSVAAASVLMTFRQVRGRTHFVDAIVPALLLNPGGWENLVLGYQLHFTITVLFAALVVRCAALADRVPPHVTAWRVALLTPLFALGGWVGLAFVPGLTLWVAFLVARGRWRDRLALALPLAACAYFAWAYIDVQQNPVPGPTRNSTIDQLRVAGEFVGLVFGNFGGWLAPVAGVVATAGTFALVVWLGRLPSRRSAAGGLAVVSALLLMAYGTAQHRPFGYAVRNIPLVAFIPVVGLLIAAKFGRPISTRQTVALLTLAVAIQVVGWYEGTRYARMHAERADDFALDRDAGLPLRYLVARHHLYACQDLVEATQVLQRHGHPFAAGVVDGPRCQPVRLEPNAAESRRFVLLTPTRVNGVRVVLHYPNASERAEIEVTWRGPGGIEGRSVCHPWLTPGDWRLDFPVGATIDSFVVQPVHSFDEFTVVAAWLLVAD